MSASFRAQPTPKPTVLVLASTYPRWINDHEPGFVHELSRRLIDRFHVIAVVPDAPDADESGDLDGVHIVRYRYAPRRLQTLVNDGGIATNLRRSPWKWLLVPGFVFMQLIAARRIARAQQIDAVHAHWLISPGVVASWLVGADKVLPCVVTSHGGDLFGFRGNMFVRIKRWVASRAAAMSVVSSAMRDEAMRIALPVERIEVIPMGVDLTSRFVPDPSVPRALRELLFVGRLVAKKGLRYLMAAMPAILERYPETVLRVIGFGPEREALEQQVADLGIAASVVFEGAMEQRHLPDAYRRASVFVAPFVRDASGDQEGLPVALMEAVGTGCPFVVGDVAGLSDLLGGTADSFRVDATSPPAIAAAVMRCLDDPGLAGAVASQVREQVRAHLDWDAIARRYADLLTDVMEKRTP
ncbi:glycosyltransferase involved in cell wall biosynthesis [Luteibacter rhizovicinus]|uniref:Glycosyltransferase involved in cell wall biosynthesis n=1 Tax=Luteibacter rhizovicinus TaxID=242606 RepID=A0A4R3YPY3_9GAMM|nr:glycosyltransferase [Luteibacter rhizovicinus]TCV94965.1 glycosyltransferase involved in cell wall biosynthesis [Luteibacter rhizovicinus]